MVVCQIVLGVVGGWARTAHPTGAYVSGCLADDGYRCDYHWTVDGDVFAGRLPGGPWPDGHVVRIWVDPHDPTHLERDKDVVTPVVWLVVFGSGLLVCVFVLTGRSVWFSVGRIRRGIALATAGGVVAAAALPSVAVVVQSSRRPPVAVTIPAAPAPDSAVLQQVVPPDPTRGNDIEVVCAAALPAPLRRAGLMIQDSDPHDGTSTIQISDGVTRTMPGVITALGVAPGGVFATGDAHGVVRLWDVTGRHVSPTLLGSGLVDSLAFSPDGRTVAVAGDTVLLWDLDNRRTMDDNIIRSDLSNGSSPWHVAFGPDSHTVSVCDDSGTTWRWRF